EALGLYVAVVGLLGATKIWEQSVAAALGLAANVFFVYAALDGRRAEVTRDRPESFVPKLLKNMAIAEWAFVVYVAALPDNPLTAWDAYKLQYGAVAAIVTAAVLPFVARKLGVAPDPQAVAPQP